MGKDTEFDYGFNTEEAVTYDCTCAIICPVCRRRFGLCTEVHEQLTRKGENNVNVGHYIKQGVAGGSGEFNPFITAKDVGKSAKFKVIGVRELHTPPRKATKDKKASAGFDGLMVDLKNGTRKYCLPVRFDRFDLGNIVAQMKSEDTDDWIGSSLKLITAKGKKGGTFVNVAKK